MQVILTGREIKLVKTHKEGFNILKQSQLFSQKGDDLFCVFYSKICEPEIYIGLEFLSKLDMEDVVEAMVQGSIGLSMKRDKQYGCVPQLSCLSPDKSINIQ